MWYSAEIKQDVADRLLRPSSVMWKSVPSRAEEDEGASAIIPAKYLLTVFLQ